MVTLSSQGCPHKPILHIWRTSSLISSPLSSHPWGAGERDLCREIILKSFHSDFEHNQRVKLT